MLLATDDLPDLLDAIKLAREERDAMRLAGDVALLERLVRAYPERARRALRELEHANDQPT